MAHYEHAIRLDPAMADAHMNLGMALLKLGDLPAGFREFEWRWTFPAPAWRDWSKTSHAAACRHKP